MDIATDQLRLAANVLRGLAIDAVEAADSGHPGLPMGMADVAATLWLEHLRYDVGDPEWRGRDRFVLSAGHGSMLLYGLLHCAGFGLPIEELERFRQLGSKTPGHPEVGETPGVETTTGPLGQGFGNGVGMALAARVEAARFDAPLLDRHRIVGIVSDGDLMEGIASEAASLAGHLRLSNLVYLYDSNHITIDGDTAMAFTEDVPRRFAAYGWRVLELDDAHDYDQIRAALDRAFDPESDRPTLLVCHSTIGFGSPNKAGTAGVHGAPLGGDEVRLTKRALGLPESETFWVPDECKAVWRTAALEKSAHARAWRDAFGAWEAKDATRAGVHRDFVARAVPNDLFDRLVDALGDTEAATRALSGQAIQHLADALPGLITGSADLNASCKTDVKDAAAVAAGSYDGRNVHFGIREHAMGAMLNGIALHGGFRPIGSTFLVFSDYMRPSIRLAALMGVPVSFVFTHDSIYVGEDGPTHQPVEQAAALRLIPGLHVFRPADGVEVAAAWTHAMQRRTGPTALLLTRQGLPRLTRPDGFDKSDALRGGYPVRKVDGPQAILLASGSEVATAVEAAEALAGDGIELGVVSMPCMELFLDQPRSWREAVLPPGVPRIALDVGSPDPWCRFTGSMERVIAVTRFGRSAPWKELREEFGFTADAIAEQVRGLLG